MTDKQISNCCNKPMCQECSKYTPEYREKYWWSCDKTCTLYPNSNLPECYAEISYEDLDSPEAVDGCRFDDMNYLRYTER